MCEISTVEVLEVSLTSSKESIFHWEHRHTHTHTQEYAEIHSNGKFWLWSMRVSKLWTLILLVAWQILAISISKFSNRRTPSQDFPWQSQTVHKIIGHWTIELGLFWGPHDDLCRAPRSWWIRPEQHETVELQVWSASKTLETWMNLWIEILKYYEYDWICVN